MMNNDYHIQPPFYSRDQERLFNKIKKCNVDIPHDLSPDTADILTKVGNDDDCHLQLLQKDPKQRLGGDEKDAEAVKQHPFFKSIDWDKLLKKEVPIPYVRLYRLTINDSYLK